MLCEMIRCRCRGLGLIINTGSHNQSGWEQIRSKSDSWRTYSMHLDPSVWVHHLAITKFKLILEETIALKKTWSGLPENRNTNDRWNLRCNGLVLMEILEYRLSMHETIRQSWITGGGSIKSVGKILEDIISMQVVAWAWIKSRSTRLQIQILK